VTVTMTVTGTGTVTGTDTSTGAHTGAVQQTHAPQVDGPHLDDNLLHVLLNVSVSVSGSVNIWTVPVT
jgi:hypothetical protein